MINLGEKVKDLVTGFEGVTTHMAESITGVRQFFVQPPVKPDGTIPDAHMIEENQLELIEANIVPVVAAQAYEYDFNDEVENPQTKFRGFIQGRAVYLNGCVRYGLQPTFNAKDKTLPKDVWFFQQELKLIKAAKKAKTKEASEEPVRKTGGPAMKLPAFNKR